MKRAKTSGVFADKSDDVFGIKIVWRGGQGIADGWGLQIAEKES
jgi:hypothetical protein